MNIFQILRAFFKMFSAGHPAILIILLLLDGIKPSSGSFFFSQRPLKGKRSVFLSYCNLVLPLSFVVSRMRPLLLLLAYINSEGVSCWSHSRSILYSSSLRNIISMATTSSQSDESDINNLSPEELDALPSLDDLIESGKARKEIFRGKDINDRFHWKTRALSGELTKVLGLTNERDENEFLVDGIQTCLISTWPTPMTITVVGKPPDTSVVTDFVTSIRQAIGDVLAEADDAEVLAQRRHATCSKTQSSYESDQPGFDNLLTIDVRERKKGKFISVTVSYIAAGAGIPARVRERIKPIPGVMMVF